MASWSGKSRGTVLGFRFFVLFINFFGLGFTYKFLRLVVVYYYLFDKKPKNILLEFYTERLGRTRKEALALVSKNFNLLGRSLVDRTAFLLGKKDQFNFKHIGHEYLKELDDKNTGAILVSAHLGNWDLAGNMLRSTDLNSEVNIVLFAAEYEKTKEYLDQATGGQRFNIIPVSEDLSHIIKINAALKKGEFICIHGDRFVEGARTETCNFLGKEAKFPIGPFEIAARTKVPICFVYNIKTDKYEYTLRSGRPIFDAHSAKELQEMYIRDLESMTYQYPEHWFNYFDVYNT